MEEFNKALETLEWRRADLARRLGVTPETVSRWQIAPRYVMAYLDAMLTLKRLRDMTARAIQP